MTKYTAQSFSGCVFNPVTNGKMVEVYPRLLDIIDTEWIQDPYLDKLIRYIICCYDPASPVVKENTDMNYRKGDSAECAGFDMVDDAELLTRIYDCEYHLFDNAEEPVIQVQLIVRYLQRFAKSHEWAAYVATEMAYWESIEKVMTPLQAGAKDKDMLSAVQIKSAIKEEIKKDLINLDDYRKKFFGGDEVMEKKIKKRQFSPERAARLS